MTSRDVENAIQGTGARLVAAVDDDSYGGHWHYTRYFVVAPGEVPEDRRTASQQVSASSEPPESSGSPAAPEA
jgi:hypothetical protein